MKVIDTAPYSLKERTEASFIAGVNSSGYFIVRKDRLSSTRGYMSKYHVRKTLKKLNSLGYGSSKWLIFKED